MDIPPFNETEYMNPFSLDSLTPILMIAFLIMLLLVLFYCYNKIRIPLLIFVVYIFILFIGFTTMKDKTIPLTPYIQILIMLISTVIMISVISDLFERKSDF